MLMKCGRKLAFPSAFGLRGFYLSTGQSDDSKVVRSDVKEKKSGYLCQFDFSLRFSR